MTDCLYPGAKKPLIILSYLFCLNTTGQNYISIPFAELILAALNGQAVDWLEEFYQELREEVLKLHHKHSQNMVKVVRTTIGPHLTLMIKAAGAMNLQHEIEARFHMAKPFCTSEPSIQPKKRRYTKKPMPPPTLHSRIRVVQPKVDQKRASTSAPEQALETPRSVVVETEEPWQVPNDIPNIVQQISQAHRRLENLLVTLSSKAPPKLMQNLDSQFYKVQREAFLHQGTKPTYDQPSPMEIGILRTLTTQVERLKKRLAGTEELNEIYIESLFEMEEVVRLKTKA